MTLQFGKRWNGSLQFDMNYTLAKGTDTAPLGGGTPVQGDAARSDHSTSRDKGNSLDIRHTFNASVVALTNFSIANRTLHHIINNNQLSLLVQVNSGTPVQIAGNTDLNGDGTNNDRPLFITRNSLNLPTRKNVDMRYSRFFNFGGHYKFELQAEFKNVFNNQQVLACRRPHGQRNDRWPPWRCEQRRADPDGG
jgi:hypothetical protein